MTCSDVMTGSPSCCVPSDSVAMAAQIMKREDVGPVPIVSDYAGQKLVGIVTDRDLVVKVMANGLDPHNTRIDEVMSHDPVTCQPDDDTRTALRLMGEHQVRRVPIVDAENRLVGIVAQADLAREEDEEEVGEMVEEISQPYGGSSDWGRQREDYGRKSYSREGDDASSESSSLASSLAIGAICLGVGASLMYLLDPSGGRSRRAVVRDKGLNSFRRLAGTSPQSQPY